MDLVSVAMAAAGILFSAGVAWGITNQKVNAMKENYIDRFDRLERMFRSGTEDIKRDLRDISHRLEGMMTKDDHDRICRWPQPPFNQTKER